MLWLLLRLHVESSLVGQVCLSPCMWGVLGSGLARLQVLLYHSNWCWLWRAVVSAWPSKRIIRNAVMQVDRSVKSRLCWSQFKTAIKEIIGKSLDKLGIIKHILLQPTIPRVDGWAYFFCFCMMRIWTLLMSIHSDGQHARIDTVCVPLYSLSAWKS